MWFGKWLELMPFTTEVRMFDIIVVGAGPVGLHTAHLCEKMGYKILIIEDDNEIGKPLKCSGLISRNIRKFFPDVEEWNVIENEVDSAVLHSKRSELTLKKEKAAYVINRTLFDKKLSEFVNSEIKLGCRAERISVNEDCVEISTSKGIFECEMAVLCAGPNSLLVKKGKMVKGLIATVKNSDSLRNVDLYFDKKMLNDGFFWKIPRGEKTEYGVWGKNVKFSDLENFFRLRNYEKYAGLIPIGTVKKSYSDRMLIAGSAAGQVKPWSGGGVIYGLTCAEIAAKIIEKAFRFNDFSGALLKEYESEWKRKIGRQIKFGLVFRRFIENSSDFQLDAAFRTGKLLNYGWMDMDFIV
jgi:flavin-dependent dehydrogenase